MSYQQPLRTLSPVFMGIALASVLSGCGYYNSDSPEVKYHVVQGAESLKLPPDLSAPDTSNQYVIPGLDLQKLTRRTLLPSMDSIKLVRDGESRWLTMDVPPEQLWPKLRDFIRSEGQQLEKDEPLQGLFRTKWSENVADAPVVGLRRLTSAVTSAIFSSTELDRFTYRAERRGDAGLRLFVTHENLQEAEVGEGEKVNDEIVETTWVPGPRSVEKENLVLQRLLVYLGVEEQRATGLLSEQDVQQLISVAYIDKNNDQEPYLFVGKPLDQAWDRVEDALDDSGFQLDESKRDQQLFEVTFYGDFKYEQQAEEKEKKGFFASLTGVMSGRDRKERQYKIALEEVAGGIHVSAIDMQEETTDPGEATAILEAVRAQF